MFIACLGRFYSITTSILQWAILRINDWTAWISGTQSCKTGKPLQWVIVLQAEHPLIQTKLSYGRVSGQCGGIHWWAILSSVGGYPYRNPKYPCGWKNEGRLQWPLYRVKSSIVPMLYYGGFCDWCFWRVINKTQKNGEWCVWWWNVGDIVGSLHW